MAIIYCGCKEYWEKPKILIVSKRTKIFEENHKHRIETMYVAGLKFCSDGFHTKRESFETGT